MHDLDVYLEAMSLAWAFVPAYFAWAFLVDERKTRQRLRAEMHQAISVAPSTTRDSRARNASVSSPLSWPKRKDPMMNKLLVTFAVLMGILASTCAYAGGTEQDTPDGNKPAAESGGSGR